MDKIGIVIVNYNGLIHNEECVNSILENNYNNIEIVVVDNKSIDGSVERLEEIYANKVTVIRNRENSGFAGGTNIGINYSLENGCDYILLLNNDTVIDNNMIMHMLETSKMNNNCVVSPKIYYFKPKKMIWSAGGEIKWNRGYTIQYGMNEIDNGQCNELKKVTFATGCCMLIPRNIVENIGLIPEEYFLYFEDTDYCLKIQQAGYEIFYEPKAVMYHKVSATTGGEDNKNFIYYFYRNRLYFNKKYNKNKRYYIFISLSWIKKCIIWLFKVKIDLIKAMKYAIRDYKKRIIGKV